MAPPAKPESLHRVPAVALRESLLQSRLVHREARLQLVIAALRERIHELHRRGARTPEPLLAALTGFQAELAEVRKTSWDAHPRRAGAGGAAHVVGRGSGGTAGRVAKPGTPPRAAALGP